MPPSNMSVQPAKTDAEGRVIRPPMKQDSHPEHNMPPSDYDGDMLDVGKSINKMVQEDETRRKGYKE